MIVIAFAGSRLSAYADRLGDRTGFGEAFMGALFLGAATSLPGITTSVVTAWEGEANLAIGNAIGGMAAQTVFLIVADFCYRSANLEHAAASVPNLLNAGLLIALLGAILMAIHAPEMAILGVHPITPLLFIGYAAGLRLSQHSFTDPQWKPLITPHTIADQVEENGETPAERRQSLSTLWGLFALAALVTGFSGWVIARCGLGLVRETGLSGSFVGAFVTAIATSTPELITTIAAVRRGALTLAVSNIIGGNAFDVLFAGAADVAYRDGSIYHRASSEDIFLIGTTITMTSLLILGLLYRERRGFISIGFEGVLVLMLYAVAFLVMYIS